MIATEIGRGIGIIVSPASRRTQAVDEVVKMREQGQSYIAIHDKVKMAKAQAKADKKAARDEHKKDKGKGKKK